MRQTEQETLASLGRLNARWLEELWAAEEYAADISAAERQKLAKEGKALSDGSYPIRNESDLRNAETLAKSGHGNVTAATALIKKRAKQLGVEHKMASSEDKGAAAGMKVCPTCKGSGEVSQGYGS